MLRQDARSFALVATLAFAAGPVAAQDDAEITRAIEQLGDESPAVRARARAMILRAGKPALEVLRRAISAHAAVLPEYLFVIAEDLARDRRNVHFELSTDTERRSWRVAWLSGGQHLGILDTHGGRVRILDDELEPTGENFGDQAAYFAFGPRGESVAYNDEGGNVVVVERKTGRRVPLPVGDKPTMVYSPDGRHVATGGYGRVVEMWSAADGTMVRQFPVAGTEGGLTPVFSPDGKVLVVGNRNGETHVFDAASGDVLHVLARRMTQQLVFSPDGTRLVIGYVDGKIGLWDVASGKLEKLLDSGLEEVFTVAWSPDGEFLASAGLSGPIVIWSGEHLARLHDLDPGSERTFRLAFRPDSKMLVAAGNQTTRAWTVESKQ